MSETQQQITPEETEGSETKTEVKPKEEEQDDASGQQTQIQSEAPPVQESKPVEESKPPAAKKKAHFEIDEKESENKKEPEEPKKKEPEEPKKKEPEEPKKKEPEEPKKKEPEQPKKKEPEQPKKKEPEQPKKKEAETKKESETPPRKQEERKRESETRESKRSSSTPGTPRSDTSERRTQKEFFKLELQRLEGGLRKESSKINKPDKKPYTPYVFNTLEPYYNTYTTRYLINLPDEVIHSNISRRTAQGLTDPWQDLRMDRDLLPLMPSKPVSRQVAILKREKELRDRKKRSAQNASSSSRNKGSTRLPKFPMVSMETQDMANKQLYYSDVPALRQELKNKYSSSAKTKVDDDYKRTQQDFYRMELDKLDEVHPVNRKHMRSAYFAYLQNTPGSKKAITECVRGLRSGKV